MITKKIKLGDLVKISKGKKHISVEDGEFRYINIENLHNPQNSLFTNERGVMVDEKDLIIAWDGANAGKVGVGYKGVIGSTLARLKVINNDVLPGYLYWFLESINELIKSQRTGATIPHINGGALKELEVPIPNLATQKYIIDIINAADILRQKDQELLRKYDELTQAVFIEMFGDPEKNEKGWDLKLINEVCDVTKLAGYEYTKHIKYSDEGEIAMIRGLNVKKEKVKLENLKYIDKKTSEYLIRSKLFFGDVVMTYIGVNIGDVAIIEDDNKFHLAPNVAKITPKNTDKLNSYYLLKYLSFSRSLFEKYTTNTAKQALNMGNIREVKIMLPDIQLQDKFEKIYLNLREQTEKSTQHSSNIYFSSVLQKAFNGELAK